MSLAKIWALITRILEILSGLTGLVQNTATEQQARNIDAAVFETYMALIDVNAGLPAVLAKLDALTGLVPVGGVPGADVNAAAVWAYLPWANLQSAGEMLSEVYSQAVWKATMGIQPYSLSPWLAVTGGMWVHDLNGSPQDIPNLDPDLMEAGDTLKEWLDRCTDPWTWSNGSGPSGHYYVKPSQDQPAFLFVCTLTEQEFRAERDARTGPSGMSETLIASDLTGEFTDLGGYAAYRLSLTTVPPWAGHRAATVPLYEVNSRADQLGWCMFGTATAWDTWRLLTWTEQVFQSPDPRTAFHVCLRPGVVADLYGLSPV